MTETITIVNLTTDSVSIKRQNMYLVDGVEYAVGNGIYKAYINELNSRNELEAEVPEPYKSAIMSIWGTSPTVVLTEKK